MIIAQDFSRLLSEGLQNWRIFQLFEWDFFSTENVRYEADEGNS